MIEGTTTAEYALLEDSIVKEVMENEPHRQVYAILRIMSPYLLPRFLSIFLYYNVFAYFRTYKGAT